MKQEEIDRIVATVIKEATHYGKDHKAIFIGIYESDLRTALASLDQTGIDGWISVDERLPEDGMYLCYINAMVNGKEKWYMLHRQMTNGEFNKLTGEIITHWQPLPPAPLEQFKNGEG